MFFNALFLRNFSFSLADPSGHSILLVPVTFSSPQTATHFSSLSPAYIFPVIVPFTFISYVKFRSLYAVPRPHFSSSSSSLSMNQNTSVTFTNRQVLPLLLFRFLSFFFPSSFLLLSVYFHHTSRITLTNTKITPLTFRSSSICSPPPSRPLFLLLILLLISIFLLFLVFKLRHRAP